MTQKRWCTSKPAPADGRSHTCSTSHFTIVSEYRALVEGERQANEWVTRRDDQRRLTTFRDYLVQCRGRAA